MRMAGGSTNLASDTSAPLKANTPIMALKPRSRPSTVLSSIGTFPLTSFIGRKRGRGELFEHPDDSARINGKIGKVNVHRQRGSGISRGRTA